MCDQYAEIFRRLSRPLEPEPVGCPSQLLPLPGLRAVLFDVYGTLLISGSGEVGTCGASDCQEALREALTACGMTLRGRPQVALDLLAQRIRCTHRQLQLEGVDYPEVDVVRIWAEVLAGLADQALICGGPWTDDELRRLAVEYEARVNPVWPMPGLESCLARLRSHGKLLGVISNAQFYTPALFVGLVGRTPEDLGFDPALQYYSYQYGRAKPGTFMHRLAAEELQRREIAPSEVLYVGNDMLNDVLPARQVGFRTALFAGDRRSYRSREDEALVAGIRPDLIVTRLAELSDCVICY